MPIKIVWGNDEKTIVTHIYVGKWTLDEFHQAVDENAALMNSVSHPVDMIADLTQSDGLPPRMLSAVGSVLRKTPKNQGMSVVVGADRFVTIMLDVALTIAPKLKSTYRHAPTLDEAYAIIEENKLATIGDQT